MKQEVSVPCPMCGEPRTVDEDLHESWNRCGNCDRTYDDALAEARTYQEIIVLRSQQRLPRPLRVLAGAVVGLNVYNIVTMTVGGQSGLPLLIYILIQMLSFVFAGAMLVLAFG